MKSQAGYVFVLICLGLVARTRVSLGSAFANTYFGVTPRLSQVLYPSSDSVNYLYFSNTGDRRLQQIQNLTKASVLISQFDYTYDAEGEIQTWTKNNPILPTPQRFDLGYDNADQLLTAPLKNASTNALIKQYTYVYDAAANRTSELVGTTTTTSTPNSVNEITSQSGGVNRTLTYDPNGSLTNDGSARTFEWDGANRLVAVNYTATTNRSEFSYDGASRVVKIVEKTAGSIVSTRKFVWCGTEKCEFRDATDAVTLRVYPQGQHPGAAGYFFTHDHLGSVREMFNSTGGVVARYDYDPYGRSTVVTMFGSTPPDFNFTGLYRHSKSNLDLAVYRAYDPDLGRWLSRDPIGEDGGVNLYGYVGNDPVNGIDPFGLYVYNIPLAYKAAYRTSWQQLFAVPGAREVFTAVNRSDARFDVSFVSYPSPNKFDPNSWSVGGTIHWDPFTAAVFPGGVQTPALALLHEFAHAADMATQTGAYLRRCDEGGEEMYVINGVEKEAAIKILGSMYRTDHKAALWHYRVSWPTQTW